MEIQPFQFPLEELHTRIMSFVESDSREVDIDIDRTFQHVRESITSYYAVQLGDDFTIYTCSFCGPDGEIYYRIKMRRNEKL